MSKEIEHKIRRFIESNQLILPGDELLLGVSGGADSMMLFHYLYKHQDFYHVSLRVAHVHHGIRTEAQDDAKLVEEICKKRGVPFHRHDCNIKQLAKEKRISEEEAGREERYNFFISLLNPTGKIVTAHNMNDQAETMMMRFFRGTDINGLGGIAPRREQVIRPLLCLTRAEIEHYCTVNEVVYRDDHTNFLPVYTRNRIRLECIPYVTEHINPAIIKVLGEHSDLYREEEDFLKSYTKACYAECAKREENQVIINRETLKHYHSYIQKRILLLSIAQLVKGIKDVTSKHIESLLTIAIGQSGKKVNLPYGLIATTSFESLIITLKEVEQIGYVYPLYLGKQFIKEANIEVNLELVQRERIEQKDEKIYTKYIDYGKMKDELCIRTRQSHDYIRLAQGTKKLKKMFIDDKVPKEKREQIPLIAQGDEIIWAVGSRLNTDYYITEETTQILQIQITFNN